MKYRFSRALLATLIASITFFYPLLAPVPHRIDQAHFESIPYGMTQEEVEAIFGVPPGKYDCAERDGGPDMILHTMSAAIEWFEFENEALTWSSRYGSFAIRFDRQNRVRSTRSWTKMRRVPFWPTLWEKMIGK